MTTSEWIVYGAVAATVGVLVATTELLTRYRDDPAKAVLCRAGCVYITMNAAISLAAFALVMCFGQDRFLKPSRTDAVRDDHPSSVPAQADAPKNGTASVHPTDAGAESAVPGLLGTALLAGFAGTVILRATVRVGSNNAAVGPGQVIDAMLLYVDRQIDRDRAKARVTSTVHRMQNVDFAKAKAYLPVMLSGAMQRLSAEEQRELGRRLGEIDQQPMTDELKSYSLGFVIMDLSGDELLESLVATGNSAISRTQPVSTSLGGP